MQRLAISRRLVVAAVGIATVVLVPNTTAGAIDIPPSAATPQPAKSQTDKLNRGVISVHTANGNRVSWRQLADDPAGTTFNVYRNGSKVNRTPVSGATSFVDAGAPAGSSTRCGPWPTGSSGSPSSRRKTR